MKIRVPSAIAVKSGDTSARGHMMHRAQGDYWVSKVWHIPSLNKNISLSLNGKKYLSKLHPETALKCILAATKKREIYTTQEEIFGEDALPDRKRLRVDSKSSLMFKMFQDVPLDMNCNDVYMAFKKKYPDRENTKEQTRGILSNLVRYNQLVNTGKRKNLQTLYRLK